jgi:hypothetical protein
MKTKGTENATEIRICCKGVSRGLLWKVKFRKDGQKRVGVKDYIIWVQK